MSKTPETGRFIPTLTEIIDSPEQMDLALKLDTKEALSSSTAQSEGKRFEPQEDAFRPRASQFGSFMDLDDSANHNFHVAPSPKSSPQTTPADHAPARDVAPHTDFGSVNIFAQSQPQASKPPRINTPVQASPSLIEQPARSNVRMTVHIPNLHPGNHPAKQPDKPFVSARVQPEVSSSRVEPSFQIPARPLTPVQPVVDLPWQKSTERDTAPPIAQSVAPPKSIAVQAEGQPPPVQSSTPSLWGSAARAATPLAPVEKAAYKPQEEELNIPAEPDIFASMSHNPAATPDSLRPSDLMLIALSERIAAKARIRIEHGIEEHIQKKIFPMLDAFADGLVAHIQGDLLKIMREGIAEATHEELERMRPRKSK